MGDTITKKIKTAYVAGALRGLPAHDAARMKRTYEWIGKICSECGIDAFISHDRARPDRHQDAAPEEVYREDTREVVTRDLLIVEATYPSHGAGGEAERAREARKRVLLCYELGADVSRYLRGNPAVEKVIEYKSLQDLKWQLCTWLMEHNA
ncbi:hypothetical protein EPO34_02210 [Patescibacteria group bacterium]|nr:MAG: hypothetical protein EPO34_02210 [Patescibacteria group bacterium]